MKRAISLTLSIVLALSVFASVCISTAYAAVTVYEEYGLCFELIGEGNAK